MQPSLVHAKVCNEFCLGRDERLVYGQLAGNDAAYDLPDLGVGHRLPHLRVKLFLPELDDHLLQIADRARLAGDAVWDPDAESLLEGKYDLD